MNIMSKSGQVYWKFRHLWAVFWNKVGCRRPIRKSPVRRLGEGKNVILALWFKSSLLILVFFLWDTGQNIYTDQRASPSLAFLMMWFISESLKYVLYFVKKYKYLTCLNTLLSKTVMCYSLYMVVLKGDLKWWFLDINE